MEKALLEMTYETELIEDAQNAEAEEDTDMTDEEDSDDIFDVTVDKEEDPTANIEAPATDKSAQDNHIFSSVNIEKNSGIFYSSYTFNAVLNPQNGEELDYDPNETFRVTLSVEMPGEITSSKGGTAEGNKIVFETTVPYAAIHNEGGTIVVTHKMKMFFRAKCYEALGLKRKSKANLEGKKRVLSDGGFYAWTQKMKLTKEAEFWRAMALKPIGSKIVIPKRQFIGTHPELEAAIFEIAEKNAIKIFKDV
jgi:phage gpG-like protein